MNKTLRRQARPPFGKVAGLVMTFYLLASTLLSPIIPVVEAATDSNYLHAERAAQQDGDNVAPEADDSTAPDTSIEKETPAETEPPTDKEAPSADTPETKEDPTDPPESTAQPTSESADAPSSDRVVSVETSALEINLYWCSPDVDIPRIRADNAENAKSQCSIPGPPIQVVLLGAANNVAIVQEVGTTPGTAVFEGVSAIELKVQFNTDGDITQSLLCQTNSVFGQPLPYEPQQISTNTSGELSFTIPTLGYETTKCDWFGGPPGLEPQASLPDDVYSTDTASIEIDLYWCNVDINIPRIRAANAEAVKSRCDIAGPPVDVAILGDANEAAISQEVDSTPGTVVFEGVSAIEVRVQFSTDDEVTHALLCQTNPSSEEAQPYTPQLSQVSPRGELIYTVPTLGYETTECDWFAQIPNTFEIPARAPESQQESATPTTEVIEQQGDDTESETGAILVYAIGCDSAPPVDADYAWYSGNCSEAQDSWPFTWRDLSGDSKSDIHHGSMVGAIETGSVLITSGTGEMVPTAVYCATIAPDKMPTPSDFAPVELTNNSVQVELTSSMLLQCNWYLVDADTVINDEPDATPEEADQSGIPAPRPATLTITTHWCPPGTAMDDSSLATCDDPAPLVPTAVQLMSNENGAHSALIDAAGQHSFENLPAPVDWWLSFQSGAVAEQALVCTSVDLETSTETTPLQRILPRSGSAYFPLSTNPNEGIDCHWYGVLVDTTPPASVSVLGYVCSDSSRLDQLPIYDLDECETRHNYRVTLSNGIEADTRSETLSGNHAQAEITNLSPGLWTIEQDPLDGYLLNYAHCVRNIHDPVLEVEHSIFPRARTDLRSLSVPIAAGEHWVCNFVWSPANEQVQSDIPGTINVTSYLCPGMVQVNYQNSCPETMEDVEFQFTSNEEEDRTDLTDGTGSLSRDLNPGRWYVHQQGEAAYYVASVLCTQAGEEDGDDYAQELVGNGFLVEITAGASIDCVVFNVPLRPEDVEETKPGAVLVYAWMCESTPPTDSEYAWYAKSCLDRIESWPFILIGSDNETKMELHVGRMQEGIDQGTVTIVSDSNDLEPLVVYCTTLMPDELPTPAQFAPFLITENQTQVQAIPGMLVQCNWYLMDATAAVEEPTSVTTPDSSVQPTPTISEPSRDRPAKSDGVIIVRKWACLEPAPKDATKDWFDKYCSQPHDGVKFIVTVGRQEKSYATGFPTSGQFEAVIPASVDVRIMASEPPGWRSTAVFCEIDGITKGPEQVKLDGTGIILSERQPANITCDWYNEPTDKERSDQLDTRTEQQMGNTGGSGIAGITRVWESASESDRYHRALSARTDT